MKLNYLNGSENKLANKSTIYQILIAEYDGKPKYEVNESCEQDRKQILNIKMRIKKIDQN